LRIIGSLHGFNKNLDELPELIFKALDYIPSTTPGIVPTVFPLSIKSIAYGPRAGRPKLVHKIFD
jgi:hypothetical protein